MRNHTNVVNLNLLLLRRLLVVVRDPVTRAISDYTQAASKKEGMKRFEELAFFNESKVIAKIKY